MDDARDEPARPSAPVDEPGGPFTRDSAGALAAGAGGIAFVVVFLGARLALVNAEGPFGEHAGLGTLATVGCALVAGGLVLGATYLLARRTAVGLFVVLGLLVGLAVVCFPTRVDVHESFVPRPNERSSCLGLEFRHYPPGTMDASSVDYCVGLERPLPPG
jgi:hypothetical protein